MGLVGPRTHLMGSQNILGRFEIKSSCDLKKNYFFPQMGPLFIKEAFENVKTSRHQLGATSKCGTIFRSDSLMTVRKIVKDPSRHHELGQQCRHRH